MADVITYISQMGLDDIESLQARSRSSALTDEELALALFAEEAEGLLNITWERASSTSSQGGSSRTVLEELEELEALARYDHLVALAISEGRPIPPMPTLHHAAAQTELFPVDDTDEWGILGAPSATQTESVVQTLTPSEETTISAQPIERRDECVICGDIIQGTAYRAPCGDTFDLNCLEDMFRRATVDVSLFPPRCCQSTIPVSDARAHLNHELMKIFDKKSLEFSTASRVYCARPTCSAFIGATTDKATPLKCLECSTETCGYCKAKAHVGAECSDKKELNDMAREMHDKEGWQRCPLCHHLVELTVGCYHIICVCKAQFCYLCGTRWKGCSCPQFAVPPDV